MFSLFHYEIMPSISESRDRFTSWRRIFEFINADYRIVFSAEKGVEQDKQLQINNYDFNTFNPDSVH